MIKQLLYVGCCLLLLAQTPEAEGRDDNDIVFYTGSAVTRSYDAGSTHYEGYFGQYAVRGSGCCGIGASADYFPFRGDPAGEIVARWNVYYLDPGKKNRPFRERILKKRYFYVRAQLPDRLPPRHRMHWIYEVYLSFGPRNVLPSGLHPADKARARPFRNSSGVEQYSVGEIGTVYYFIRSRPKDVRPADWPSVSKSPYPFAAVKGIEITQEQYMTIACEKVGSDTCKAHLDLDAPGLTPQQIAYIRRTRKAQ